MKKVYADNSSTSFPKAPGIADVIKDFLEYSGCNINRGSYAAAYDIAMEIVDLRQMLADMFHSWDPREVILTPSATYSLNMLLAGLLKKGDHVITTSMEHNSIMRPLHSLSKIGVAYDTVPCASDGTLQAKDIIPFIRKETKALVTLHASNVCGAVAPLAELVEICQKYQIRLIIDAAQTAGVLDIDATDFDAVTFSGHKGLLGPQGVGGFIIKKAFAEEISPLIVGGTGSLSHEIEQPDFLPDKFEAGTMNIPGILGLKKAVEYIVSIGMASIYAKEIALTMAFIDRMRGVDGVDIIGKEDSERRVAVVSLNFPKHDNALIATALDENYGIMTRCGLHCAPLAHKTLNTYPNGTVRFSFGHFNTMDEVEYIAQSIKEILRKA